MATRAPLVLKFESLSMSAGLPPVVDKDARLSGYADTADRAGSNSLSIGIVLVWPNLTSLVCSSGL